MRKILLKSVVQAPLTEPAPAADETALAELAAHVDRAARRRLGRSLAIREVDAGSCNGCELEFDVPVVQAGDVNARVWIRVREVGQSVALIEQLLAALPTGSIYAEARPGAGEGLALVEGFRGDIFVWVRMRSDGHVERCHLRDPSWFQWPLLEAAIEGNIVADFPLCNKSFNCSYSGHDL